MSTYEHDANQQNTRENSYSRDGDRPARREGGFGDRAPRREFGDRPARREGGFGDRAPRREFGDRPPRREGGGFGDRGPRRDFGDRGPRREFGDRAPRPEGGGFGDRGPRRDFGDRAPRPEGSGFGNRGPRRDFGDRPPRPEGSGFGNRGPRRDFGDRAPRPEGGGFGDRKPFERRERPEGGGFGDRGPRREFGDRAPRPEGGGFGDRGPRRDFGDRAPRRDFGDRPPRSEGGFGDRPPRRDFGDRKPFERREGGFRDRREGGGFGDRPPRREFSDRPRREGGFGRETRDFVRNNYDDATPPARPELMADQSSNMILDLEQPQRIQKVLSHLGVAARRKAELMIEAGEVKVNGEVAILGQKISLSDQVMINGHVIDLHKTMQRPRVIIYHKPAGEIVSEADPEGRPSVFERLPKIRDGKWVAIGRLDFNTEGLLIFTNHGGLAQSMMHPRYELEREYAVRIAGTLTPEDKNELLAGINLEDGTANFLSLKEAGGENLNHWYHVVLCEGRNREVRRLFEAVNQSVSRLIRVRYGNMAMPKHLKYGFWEELKEDQVKEMIDQYLTTQIQVQAEGQNQAQNQAE